jgi:cytoskeletal protein CcmA (bactofilin family)
MKQMINKIINSDKNREFYFRKRHQKGSVFILSLFVTLILVILTGFYLTMIVSEHRMTSRLYSSTAAINLAEAGVERAIWELNYGGADFLSSEGWSGTDPKVLTDTLQTPAGDTIGSYTVTVINYTGSNPEIEATGYAPNQTSPQGQRSVKVKLQRAAQSLFSMAAFGIEGVRLDSGCLTDSYDSSLGSYDPSTAGSNGDIGTDSITAGAIDLDGTVNGDAVVGPDGDPSTVISGSGTITGTTSAAPSASNPSPVSPPSGLPIQSDIVMGAYASITISSSGQYAIIDLGKESVITIDSSANPDPTEPIQLYITDTLNFDRDSQMRIINNTTVEIYMGSGSLLEFDRGSLINNVSKNPRKLALYGTAGFDDTRALAEGLEGAIDIDQGSEFYGTIHAPEATVDIDRNGQLYGAIVANKVEVDRDSGIHFDEALLSSGSSSSNLFTISSWQEK